MESDNNRASNDGAEELGRVCFLVVGHLYYELENGVVNFLIVSGRVPTTNMGYPSVLGILLYEFDFVRYFERSILNMLERNMREGIVSLVVQIL